MLDDYVMNGMNGAYAMKQYTIYWFFERLNVDLMMLKRQQNFTGGGSFLAVYRALSLFLLSTNVMASSLPTLFTDLQRATIEGNDDRSLELCNDILKQSPNDQTALHCKVVTLIRLGQYDDALSLIARKFKGTDVDVSFERIYCYYRTNQLKQALELLNEIKAANNTTSPGILYLEAQLVRLK